MKERTDIKFCVKIGTNANEMLDLLECLMENMLCRNRVILSFMSSSKKGDKKCMMK